jgi:hypothetical protein
MEVLKITTQSLEDALNGIPAVEGTTPENTEKAVDFHVCILEGGTVAGNTSLMFVLKDKRGVFHVAEMTKGLFDGLAGAFKGAVERFGK